LARVRSSDGCRRLRGSPGIALQGCATVVRLVMKLGGKAGGKRVSLVDRTSQNVTVVLPCLNEQEAVGLCVRQARDALLAGRLDGEVLVVDNGSTDHSVEVATAAGARVIAEPRRGYGRALRTGFEHACADVVVMADADGTYDLSEIPRIARPVLDGAADLVLATRLDGARRGSMPVLHRYLGTPVITFLTGRACGRKVTNDSQTGYRVFPRDQVLDMGLQSDGMELASEMLIKAARADLRIRDIECGYAARIGESKLNTWSDGWRHLMLILLLAPDLLLIGPGLVLAAIGLATLGLAFVQPGGVEIGSARWQPVFFSGIALVLGVQALLAGVVLAHMSPVPMASKRRFAFIDEPRLPNRALATGVIAILCGLAIDLGLFVAWWNDAGSSPTSGIEFGFACLAQILLILGGTIALSGIIARFVQRPSSPEIARSPSTSADRIGLGT
jgi:glycosyltransferase involved in cell wall biosynthesis